MPILLGERRGNLLLQYGAGYLNSQFPDFLRTYLHSSRSSGFYGGSITLSGVSGDPITGDIGSFTARGTSDRLVPLPPAVPILFNDQGEVLALRVDTGVYRLVYFTFELDTIPDKEIKDTLIRNAVRWLGSQRTEVVASAGGDVLPKGFRLSQNVPNPFNAETGIGFELPGEAEVRLEIYDPLGRRVRRLVDGSYGGGVHLVKWDGRDEAGLEVGSGIYFYRLSAEGLVQVRRMVLLH